MKWGVLNLERPKIIWKELIDKHLRSLHLTEEISSEDE